MKWDGVRTVAYLAGGRVKLLSRKGRDDTAAYFDVVADLAAIEVETAVLDGEIVVTDPAGRPDFGLLQNRINLTRPADIERAAKTWPAQLMLFDILAAERAVADQAAVRRAPRRSWRAWSSPSKGSRVQVPPIFDGDLHAAMDTSKALRLEGVVAKQVAARSTNPAAGARPGSRSSTTPTQEVVIGGWRPGQGRRDGGIGSLLMGDPDRRRGCATSAGSARASTTASSTRSRRMLDRLARKTSPLIDVPREDARDAHWVTPSLVGEVTYGELTEPGRLRHPVWRGLRPDKSPDEVIWETPVSPELSRCLSCRGLAHVESTAGPGVQPAVGREPLGFGSRADRGRLAQRLAHSSSRRLNSRPPPSGRQVPTISTPDSTAPGRPMTGHSALCLAGVRHDQVPVPALQEQVVAAEQPEQRIESDGHLARSCQPPAPLSVDRDLDRVLGPVRLDLGHRRVQEAGDVLRGRRPEEAQVVADGLQVLRGGERVVSRPGRSPRPARDAAQHRRRGARLQLQTGVQGADPEGLLPRHGRPRRARSSAGRARRAPAVSRVETSPLTSGWLTTVRSWPATSASPSRPEIPGGLERLVRPDDPLGRVPVRERRRGHHARRTARPAGSSAASCAASRPGRRRGQLSSSSALATGTPRLASAQLAPSRPVSWTPKSKIAASVSARSRGSRSSCWASIR